MKKTIACLLITPISLLTLASLMIVGCSKSSNAFVTLAPEQVPTVMNQAFKQSTGETKELANECVAASQNQKSSAAFTKLEQLARQSNLTPEQRATAARAMAATFKQLRAASESGDQVATATMKRYLSNR